MRSAVSFVLAAICLALALAGDAPASAAASSVAYTPQAEVLALSAFGNFACKVNAVRISTENPGMRSTDSAEPFIDVDSVRSAFENVATLEWAHIAQASFSSFDGRNEEKILGTPGGDMGEFIQGIAALSKLMGRKLTDQEVFHVFDKYLRVMTRSKFFYETDEKAYVRLALATGCRNLHVADMGGMKHKREAYLAKIAAPEHIGDPFIHFLATNATDLSLDADFIKFSLAAYHNVLWTKPSRQSTKLCYLETKGPRKELAVVNIKTPSFCIDQGLAPMVSPALACPGPVFINHADAVRVFRRELVAVMFDTFKDNLTQLKISPADVMSEFNASAESNLNKFLSEAAPTVPVYTVEFLNSSPLLSIE